MGTLYQERVDRMTKKYDNEQCMLPADVLGLITDLHDLVSKLTGRVADVEKIYYKRGEP
jgi:hypothetical protein